MVKTICTTSNAYLHLVPVFFYCFNKYIPGEQVTLLCYDIPTCQLPDNVECVSMGKQGHVNEWSTDIRKWAEAQPDSWFLWMFEDSLLKAPVNEGGMIIAHAMCMNGVGRIALTKDILNRPHTERDGIIWANPDTRYRLSTQPSIWAKEFLLQYLAPGLTPWIFETQDPVNDGWQIVGTNEPALSHNEGVTKRDIYKLDLNGFCEEDIDHIKTLAPWLK